MRSFKFQIGEQSFVVNEVSHASMRGRRVTEIEVRQDCGSYYHQFRNGHVPRNASEAVVRNYVRDFYAEDQDEYYAA